jgi:hypothetical protein
MEMTAVAMRMPSVLRDRIKELGRRQHRNMTEMMLHLIETGLALEAQSQSEIASHPSMSGGCASPALSAYPEGRSAYAEPQ